MNDFFYPGHTVVMSEEKKSEDVQGEEKTQVTTPTSNWWSPWVEAAKLKSCEVLEFVKKDLNEISTVVKAEASSVVNSTANALKDTFKLEEPNSRANSVKRSVSSFLGTVSSVLSPMPEDDDQEAVIIKNDDLVKLSPFQIKLHELIQNPDTFLVDIEESLLPQYRSWLEIIDDQLTTEKLTKQLVASADLHNQYETLVPQRVSHIVFWKRYLFRKALLEDEESRREIKEKKEKEQIEKVQWDKGNPIEDFAKNIELSEEEQIRILSEYEKEKKKSPSPSKEDSKKVTKKASKESDSPMDELNMSVKKDLVIVGDPGGSQMSTSSGDTESKDTGDDWEKDFELEDTEVEALTGLK
ncbi:UNVERIFIED_CONTAM: hypothetical protein PYX00_004929 [Menopon gallinae]|uniref:BSD domain-containing protein n=1 Tax=Menopon gallinae TaxID=328185 RepID=A0AAW2I5T6_9NEOP